MSESQEVIYKSKEMIFGQPKITIIKSKKYRRAASYSGFICNLHQ